MFRGCLLSNQWEVVINNIVHTQVNLHACGEISHFSPAYVQFFNGYMYSLLPAPTVGRAGSCPHHGRRNYPHSGISSLFRHAFYFYPGDINRGILHGCCSDYT